MSGITINDFTVTMETYGANRLQNRIGSRYSVIVPCFEVCGVAFMHSGSAQHILGMLRITGGVKFTVLKV